MVPAMIHASSSFLSILVDAAARSILLVCFAAALLTVFRVKSVRMKLLSSRGVLIAALFMPLLIALCPAIPLPVLIPNLPQRAAVQADAPQTAAAYSPAVTPVVGILPKTANITPATSKAASASKRAPLTSAGRRQIPWLVLAFAAYLAIVFAFFLRLAIGIRYGKRLQDAATSIRDLRAMGILFVASRAAGLRAIPRLAESEMLSVPLMLGVREPVVLLPAGWRKWDDEEFAAVLAHELSHIERHDALWQRLALIHRAIFWFSPLAWWLERHLAEISEQASDEAALAGGADRTRYAETLLGFFAELEAAPERVWWHGVAMAKAGQAEKRVERILAWRKAMSNRLTKALAIWLVICAAPVVALTASLHPSFFGLQAQQIPALPPPPPPKLAPPASPSASSEPESAPLPAVAPLPNLPNDPSAPSTSDAAPNVVPLAPPQQVAPVPPEAQVPVTPPAPPRPPAPVADWGNWNWGANWPWGSRFVIVTPGSEPWMMSGSGEDMEHAKSLSDKIPGDFIWFERDEKSYVIRDQATIDRAKQLWSGSSDFAKQQEALREKQEELGKEMREQVQQKMNELRVKIPDLTAEIQKLQSEVKDLNASGATLQQLGDLQKEVGELQRELGETRWQAGSQMNDLGRQAGDLGRQMGELGRQEGEIARQQVERARQGAEQMKQLLDDAIAKGLAKPE